MREQDYRAIDAINWSTLRSMRVSPKQYQHDLTAERVESPAMRMGLAIHTLTLEPETWADRYAVWEGQRRGKAWLEFRDENTDRVILTDSELEQASAASHAVMCHPLARKHLATGAVEHVIRWTDVETGLRCKGRVDTVGSRLVELKSSRDVVQRRFAATAARLAYHGQCAFYEDGLREEGHAIELPPVIIAVQQEPPHDVAVYRMPHDVVDQGRRLYRSLLRTLRDCLERDEWPGVCTDEELELWLPPWAEDGDDEDEPLIIGGAEVRI